MNISSWPLGDLRVGLVGLLMVGGLGLPSATVVQANEFPRPIKATPTILAVSVAAGEYHVCAIVSNGGVKCWGHNGSGQLGNGTTTSSLNPINVIGLSSGAISLAAGRAHTCAVTNTGGVKCWGFNGFGQLGNGSTTDSTTPVDVTGLSSGVIAVAVGDSHTCAVTGMGSVKCWGFNGYWLLGDGIATGSTIPIDVTELSNGIVDVTAGGAHTCAVTNTGAVKCWGSNLFGQLEDSTTRNSPIPVEVTGLSSGVTDVAAGSSHTCAVTDIGAVKCWGNNEHGQLGSGTITNSALPVGVIGLSGGVVKLTTGDSHTCIATTMGAVKCWGRNGHGQLGNGATTDSSTPVDVIGLSSGVIALAAGDYHTCAVTNTGNVKCWGSNFNGQLGNGNTTNSAIPVDVTDLGSSVNTLAAGSFHTCAVTSTGVVKCWGNNYHGQLGDGTTTNSLIPVKVVGFHDAVKLVKTGSAHSCAITNTGAVKCWGNNEYAQLGNGTTTGSTKPTNVTELSSGIGKLTTGSTHTCAVTTTGTLKCWGNNGSGQLGRGYSWSSTPQTVILSGWTALIYLNGDNNLDRYTEELFNKLEKSVAQNPSNEVIVL